MNYSDIIKANAKGQIVIPKEVRETLHIDDKTYLKLSTQGSTIYIEPIKKFVGAQDQKKSIRQILDETRGAWGPLTKEEIAWAKKLKAYRRRRAEERRKAW